MLKFIKLVSKIVGTIGIARLIVFFLTPSNVLFKSEYLDGIFLFIGKAVLVYAIYKISVTFVLTLFPECKTEYESLKMEALNIVPRVRQSILERLACVIKAKGVNVKVKSNVVVLHRRAV